MGTQADRQQVVTLIKNRGPVVLLKDADAAGISRALIRRLYTRGEVLRLAKSAFVLTEIFEAATSWEKFRLRSIAFALNTCEGTFLTGQAAAAVLKLPMLSDPPARPTALRPGSGHIGHNLSEYGMVRHGYLPGHHQTHRAGISVVSPAYCAVDVARHCGSRIGLVVADRVLASGTSREVLANLTLEMRDYPGIGNARWVAAAADAGAESPLETLGRLAFLSAGLEPPLSNVWIPAGGQWFRVDHLLPDSGVILEADGAVKYDQRLDASTLVVKDREREQHLRSLGFGLVRYTWSMAENRPAEIVRRAREAGRLRGARVPPTCWSLDSPWQNGAGTGISKRDDLPSLPEWTVPVLVDTGRGCCSS